MGGLGGLRRPCQIFGGWEVFRPPTPAIHWQGPSEAHLTRTIWRIVRSAPRSGIPRSKGDLTDSPAACRAYRAVHSCLWDWSRVRGYTGDNGKEHGNYYLGFRAGV